MTIYDDDFAKSKALRLQALIARFDLHDFVDSEWGDTYEDFKHSNLFDFLDAYDDLELEKIAIQKERNMLRGHLKIIEKNFNQMKEEV